MAGSTLAFGDAQLQVYIQVPQGDPGRAVLPAIKALPARTWGPRCPHRPPPPDRQLTAGAEEHPAPCTCATSPEPAGLQRHLSPAPARLPGPDSSPGPAAASAGERKRCVSKWRPQEQNGDSIRENCVCEDCAAWGAA